MRSQKMIKYLPVYERSSKMFRHIINAEAKEIDNKTLDIDDFMKQLSVDTAEWGLDIYEKELGIKTDINKSYEERRSCIKSKLRGTGKVDAALIKTVAEAYNNGEVDVLLDKDVGNIVIKFIARDGIPQNLTDLKKAIGDIKPAHLGVIYDFIYLIWSNLDARNISWNELDTKNLIWDEFETGVW